MILERLASTCAAADGMAFALPAYLEQRQIALLGTLADRLAVQKRLPLSPLLGSATAPLALALAAYAEQQWSGTALVLDADDHALTWSVVAVAEDQLHALDSEILPQLSVRTWKERLLNIAADHCVRHSRRDPRDLGVAEQELYEQFDQALEACRQGHRSELVIHTGTWYQNLVWEPDELVDYCAPLVRRAVAGVQPLLAETEAYGAPSAMLVTAAAGRLPGLVAALGEVLAQPQPRQEPAEDDFGLGLFDGSETARSGVCVLSPDAAARAVYQLAVDFQSGNLQASHLWAASLPSPQPVDAGPARLLFRGQEYVLPGLEFILGRHPACDLVSRQGAVPDRGHAPLRDRAGPRCVYPVGPEPQRYAG